MQSLSPTQDSTPSHSLSLGPDTSDTPNSLFDTPTPSGTLLLLSPSAGTSSTRHTPAPTRRGGGGGGEAPQSDGDVVVTISDGDKLEEDGLEMVERRRDDARARGLKVDVPRLQLEQVKAGQTNGQRRDVQHAQDGGDDEHHHDGDDEHGDEDDDEDDKKEEEDEEWRQGERASKIQSAGIQNVYVPPRQRATVAGALPRSRELLSSVSCRFRDAELEAQHTTSKTSKLKKQLEALYVVLIINEVWSLLNLSETAMAAAHVFNLVLGVGLLILVRRVPSEREHESRLRSGTTQHHASTTSGDMRKSTTPRSESRPVSSRTPRAALSDEHEYYSNTPSFHVLSLVPVVSWTLEKMIELPLVHHGETECTEAESIITTSLLLAPWIWLAVLRVDFWFMGPLQFVTAAYFVGWIELGDGQCVRATDVVLMVALTTFLSYTQARAERVDFFRTVQLRRGEARALESTNVFTRYVFHEIRVPFNALFLGLEYLGDSPEDSVDTVPLLMSQAESIRTILDDVLSLQKLQEGRLELNVRPFSIPKLVAGVLWSHRSASEQKGIDMSYVVGDDIPDMVGGDMLRVKQVLANFVSNALKFTSRDGKVSISVHRCDKESILSLHSAAMSTNDLLHADSTADVRRVVDPPEATTDTSEESPVASAPTRISFSTEEQVWVVFAVRDTGVGISRDDQARLFVPFSQINPETLQQGRGSGLGLNICKMLCELHGGYISLWSQPGVGSEFAAYLPMRYSNVERDTEARVAEQQARNTTLEETPPRRGHTFVAGFAPRRLSTTRMKSADASETDTSAPSTPSDSLIFLSPTPRQSRAHVNRGMMKRSSRVGHSPIRIACSDPEVSPGGTDTDPSPRADSARLPSPTTRLATLKSLKTLATSGLNPSSRVGDRYTVRHDGSSGSSGNSSGNNGSGSSTRRGSEPGAHKRNRSWASGAPPQTLAPAVPKKRNGKVVLVAEDNKVNQKIMRKLLSKLGHEVIIADNGKQVVDRFSENLHPGVDLILMDNTMPVMNGTEATRLLRQLGVRIPIIALTGNALLEDREAFMSAGVDCLLTKPATRAKIEGVLAEYLTLPVTPPIASRRLRSPDERAED